METADHDRDACRPQRTRDIEGAWILIGLHAHQAHHAETVVAADEANDVLGLDAGVGLVDRGQLDVHIRAEHPAFGRVSRERIDAGERI